MGSISKALGVHARGHALVRLSGALRAHDRPAGVLTYLARRTSRKHHLGRLSSSGAGSTKLPTPPATAPISPTSSVPSSGIPMPAPKPVR
jgi:hypothetical protein